MPNSCLVPGCTEKSRMGQKVSFHVLPVRDDQRCKLWLRAINNPRVGEFAGMEIVKGKTICSLHFKLEDYDRHLFGMIRQSLKPTAVPSVFAVGRFPDDEQPGAANAPPAAKRTRPQEPGEKDGVCQRPENRDEWATTSHSEIKENGDYQEEEEEVSTSLSVGDGRHLVDLGSSSEFIVDEECIVQLLRSCRICNRNCLVETDVRGLKLTVSQTCRHCQSHFIWTNLPDEDEEEEVGDFSDFRNGEDAARGQTSTALTLGGDAS